MPDAALDFEAHLEERVRAHASPVGDLLDYHFGYGAHGPARRGKRLRPRIVLGVAAAEGAPVADALDAAAAIEILHNYSLVHDDIEDRDELRHGRTTLWAAYGIAQAINAGDAMCACSFLTLARGRERHPPGTVLQMIVALHTAHRTMCDGQALDLTFETARAVDLATYRRMIGAKTAALFDAACRLGALAARCDAAAVEEYAGLGHAYGTAFQIQDDVHGIWGAPGATGKTACGDILRRKWTFPIVWALGQPDSPARSEIARAYSGAPSPVSEADCVRVVAALDDLGAREAAGRAYAEHLDVIERFPKAGVRDLLLAPFGLTAS